MKYDAITIDTEVVDHNGFNFDSGLLSQLKQFSEGPVQVVISLVVIREMNKHLIEKTQSAKDSYIQAHKNALLYGLIKAPPEIAISQERTEDVAKNRLLRYLNSIGAISIPYEDISAQEVLTSYFHSLPPFSREGKKKHEFPDAVALISLERWAKNHQKKILAVSSDPDWMQFSKRTDCLTVVKELADALNELQEHLEESNIVIQDILSSIRKSGHEELNEYFEKNLELAISEIDIFAEADSALEYDLDQIEISLIDFNISKDNGEFIAKVVQSGPNTITASIEIRAVISAEGYFSLYVYDSVDKDRVYMGPAYSRKEEEFDVTILATFEGNFSDGSYVNTKIEVIEAPRSIDFGHLNFSNDEDLDFGSDDDHDPDDTEPSSDDF